MNELDLIKKIKELKKIRPRKDWVVLTKKGIFREESPIVREQFPGIFEIFPRMFYYYKPALATLIFLIISFVAVFTFAQDALPGDFLYSLKRISEKGQAIFVSETDKPKAQLELTNKRLEELTEIAGSNQIQKLAPAINEVQTSYRQVAQDLKESKKITQEIVDQTKKLEENKKKVESLGVIVAETEELDNVLSQLVEREIKDLESRTLPEEKIELLEETKIDFEEGNFSAALEKILLISNQQN